MKKKPITREKISPIRKIQKLYSLTNPEALKLRILWTNLKLLSLRVHGDSTRNRKTIAHYDQQWKVIEQWEQSQVSH